MSSAFSGHCRISCTYFFLSLTWAVLLLLHTEHTQGAQERERSSLCRRHTALLLRSTVHVHSKFNSGTRAAGNNDLQTTVTEYCQVNYYSTTALSSIPPFLSLSLSL
eukprot:scpid36029/ scgid32862/ 